MEEGVCPVTFSVVRGKEARKKARQSLQLWHVQVGSRPSGHAAHQHWVFKVHNCQQANS